LGYFRGYCIYCDPITRGFEEHHEILFFLSRLSSNV
jgi:hypothetical protein